MSASKKNIAALITAASLACAAFGVQAQTAAAQPQAKHHVDPAQRAQHHAQRTAELKQKLNLTGPQLAAWDQYQAAMQPQAGMGHKGQQRGDKAQLTDAQRAEMRQHMQAQHQARDNARQAFYAQLSPAQQQVFDAETHHGKGKGPRRGGDQHRPAQ